MDERRRLLWDYLATFPEKPGPVGLPRTVQGTVADLPMAPGPQPHNGGITPGYEPPRHAGDAATLADVERAVGDAADNVAMEGEEGRRRLEDKVRELKSENWDMALLIARLKLRLERLEKAHGSPHDQRSSGTEGEGRSAG